MFGVSGLRAEPLQLPGAGARLRARAGYALWAFLWVLGHVAGGALLGAALGWAGGGLPARALALRPAILSAGCLVWGLHQLGVVTVPMPEIPRQVSRAWILRLPWGLLALGYGAQLGCGVATRIPVATTYAVLACALLSGDPAAGAAILGLFGAARAAPPAAVGPRLRSRGHALGFALALDRYEGRVHRVNGLALLASAAFFAAVSFRLLPG
jgi:hypothetical protein